MMLVFRGQAPGRPGSPPSPPLLGPPHHGPHVHVTPWGPHRLWSLPHGDLSTCQFLSPRVSPRLPVLNHSSAYVCLSPCVSGSPSMPLCLPVSHTQSRNVTVHPTPFCPSPCISSTPLRVLIRAPPSSDGCGPQWATYLCGRTIRSESGLCPLAGWHGRHPLSPWRPGVLIARVCTPG